MATPILSTKLYIPRNRPDLVPRQRLLDQLAEGAAQKLVLVSAPAGSGKTTILASWAQQRDMPVAWLSLDGDDNDPVRFLTYLVFALQTIAPDIGESSLPLLGATAPVALNSILITLINELSSIPQGLFLFLDDYHVIDAHEVHDTLSYLIDHLPPNIHLFLASRSDPPLPLSRWRVRGQLLELRQADLRFTAEESAAFLAQNTNFQLSAEQLLALEERTEGWIAGLQLAALSLRGKEDVAGFVREFSGSHRFLIDYLAEEVLSQQPDDVRYFLRQTSILDRFTPSLCDAVTGRDDSASLLRGFEEANLFLIPLDDRREWYRYHHLFSDFLRADLVGEDRTELHRKASEWFASRELDTEAVKHALASTDTAYAASAVANAAPRAFNQGSLKLLLRWLDALPQQAVLENVALAVYKGFALFLTQAIDEVQPYLDAAEHGLDGETPSAVQGLFMSLKAHMLVWQGELDACVTFARDALEHLDEAASSVRYLTFNVLGQVLELKGDVLSAAGVYRQAFRSGWQAGDKMGSLVLLANLVFSLNELGRRREATGWCEQLLSHEEEAAGHRSPLLDGVDLPRSLLSYEANELDNAQEQVQRALALVTAADFTQGIIWGNYILGQIYLARGEETLMFDVIQSGLALTSQLGRSSLQGTWFAALEAQAHLQQGNLDAANRWANSTGFSAHDTPDHWLESPYFTYVRLLLAQGRLPEAETLLRNIEENAGNGRRARKLITTYLLQALLLEAQGDKRHSGEKLENAVRLAAPEDFRRAFLNEGEQITQLLPVAKAAAPRFVDELLVAFGATPAPVRQPTTGAGLMDPLTDRELEMLKLVALGLSNRQIAERVFVTLGTVKKHLNNIYSKLGVASRTQAIVKGSELGLLD